MQFEPKPFDELLQDKTKRYLYEIGVPCGSSIGAIELNISGELTLLPDNEVQISYPEEEGLIFFIDSEKNDALYCYSQHFQEPLFVNSTLENYILCLYELEEFRENIYSKQVFGNPDKGGGLFKKYALYLEEQLLKIEQDLSYWSLEIEEVEYGFR